MISYSFTVAEGQSLSFYATMSRIDNSARVYLNGNYESSITTDIQGIRVVITIPASLATPSKLPATYKVFTSNDGWSTKKAILSGIAYLKRAEAAVDPSDPSDVGVAGGVAALDADGDVVNASGQKIYPGPPIIALGMDDPLPEGIRSGTVVLRAATTVA